MLGLPSVDENAPEASERLTLDPLLIAPALAGDTEQPIEATAERVLLIACGALAREVLDLRQANGWTHLDLQCLPANLHLWPDRITAAVEHAVLQHRDSYGQIFVVYADCGTGGQLQQKCDELGVEMVAGPHCYAFYEGIAAFEARAEHEFTAFYLTDFLVRQFDAFVWKPMGLDRHPELRDMIFGNYQKLIYQAQTEDAGLDAKARECAARLGLAYERRFTGYGDLTAALKHAAEKTRQASAAPVMRQDMNPDR